uniref:DUF4219 domain-containing protein n=1 Tax=Oryza punctata TaxID=4537 RepID=A0A0E0JJ29_ORYPU
MAREKSPAGTPGSGGGAGDHGGAVVAARLAGKVVSIHYPVLSDTNYGMWAIKMKIILRHLGIWAEVVGEGSSAGEEKDIEALTAISQAVSDAVMMAIANKDTPKEDERQRGSIKKARLQALKSIEQWSDVSKISVAQANGHLRVFEESWKGRRRENEGHGNGRSDDNDDNDGSDFNSSERKFDRKKVKYYNCDIRRYFANECHNPKKEEVLLAAADDEPTLL